ncbi:WecB/TagA/CpsF family glycosyltransferase [Microbulbifer sp. SH-1]|uniref:WecB/TagA/CpsF family glycosyltransferase n=1 Tax=Microbulbifer sp. SH-1 TaxID=2681547 RepID=UPI001407DFDC|nr:WecB/TagA/CpsF family glycosyltransferase [Microbulbifer sp. SH-1]QIL90630.1 WecB/TagA/CpsF family glycosyltransferase [Microbulbifer sp. SH-1]
MTSNFSSLNIGLCRIDMIDMDRALSQIVAMRQKKCKGYVVTPNIDHLARLAGSRRSGSLQRVYVNASLSLCDSRILEFMLKLHGNRIPEVVTGSDLTARLFNDELNEKDSVYILGGSDEILMRIKNRYPRINITHHNPTMGFIRKPGEVDAIVAHIAEADPDYVFLAVGSPQQEILANLLQNTDEYRGVTLCIGASILFLAGAEKRAPNWMRQLRLEWLYRMSQNPSRLTIRYLKNALSLPAINRHLARNLQGTTL